MMIPPRSMPTAVAVRPPLMHFGDTGQAKKTGGTNSAKPMDIWEKRWKRWEMKKARYGYKEPGLWEDLRNFYKAGYNSPLPLYQRPLAFLSLDNLKHGWKKADKHFKKRKGWSKALEIAFIATEIILGAVSFGVLPIWHLLFPQTCISSSCKKFILTAQERAADKLRK